MCSCRMRKSPLLTNDGQDRRTKTFCVLFIARSSAEVGVPHAPRFATQPRPLRRPRRQLGRHPRSVARGSSPLVSTILNSPPTSSRTSWCAASLQARSDRVDNPVAWLYRSARNAVIDHYRTRRHHESIDDDDRWPDHDPASDEPNEATRELSHCLQPMIDQLAPLAREALLRVDVDGQTQQSAAEALSLSVSGMKSRVQRARRELKQLLEQCCTVEVDRNGAISDYQRSTGPCGCSSTPARCS